MLQQVPKQVPTGLHHARAVPLLAALVAVASAVAVAQISEVTPEELDAVPTGHQDVARNLGPVGGNLSGKNTGPPAGVRGGRGAPPGGGGPGGAGSATAVTGSADPRDLRGFWAGGRGGGGEGFRGDDRPGPRVDSKYELPLLCLVPPGTEASGGHIFQTDKVVTWVTGNDLRVRRIWLNGEHPKELKPSYGGHSVGRWEGDTLVIDTVALQGTFGYAPDARRHGGGADIYDQVTTVKGQKLPPPTEFYKNTVVMTTPTLHVVETLRKSSDNTQLVHERRYEDPATGMTPYTRAATYNLSRPAAYLESYCEDAGEFFGPEYAENSIPK